jgi:hypothetical protein
MVTRPIRSLKYLLRSVTNLHRQADLKNIFLLSSPRSGSTWLLELLSSQPRMKYYDEPLNPRRPDVARAGVITSWEQLLPDAENPELIIRYLNRLQRGRPRFMSPPPFRRNYRYLTSRIVFKIHELGHLAPEIEEQCNGQIVYLLRHPVATSISRQVYPRLELFVQSKSYRDRFLSDEQIREIETICRHGSKLQRGLVEWCYENLLPLKTRADRDWLYITYEELVLNPARCCKLFLERLGLRDLGGLLRGVGEPSSNIAMSSADTQSIMSDTDDLRRKRKLVGKWKGKVSVGDERKADEILALFGLDVYSCAELLAQPAYLHFDETPRLLSGPDRASA